MMMPDGLRIEHFLHVAWNAEDMMALDARTGDPASQAIWEAFALLLAVATWRPLLEVVQGTLELRGDAQGVLQAVLSRRARCPTINLIIAEMQLVLGASMLDMFASHVWSEENEVADALSRLAEGAAMPEDCATAKKWEAVRLCWRFVGHRKRKPPQKPEQRVPLLD